MQPKYVLQKFEFKRLACPAQIFLYTTASVMDPFLAACAQNQVIPNSVLMNAASPFTFLCYPINQQHAELKMPLQAFLYITSSTICAIIL